MHARNVAFAIGITLLLGCSQEQPAEWTPDTAAQQQITAAATAFGDPLPGLTADELALFQQGKDVFEEVEGVADGLGPVFNEASCVACHAGPATGGSTGRLETRFGRRNEIRIFNRLKVTFDPLAELGGSLLQDHGIGPVPGHDFPAETVPAKANVVASRRTTPLFGLGLVDATPDAQFRSIAAWQARNAPDAAGTVAVVDNLFTGARSVAKFGWKNVNPTLLQFSGDAYLNEMGIEGSHANHHLAGLPAHVSMIHAHAPILPPCFQTSKRTLEALEGLEAFFIVELWEPNPVVTG